MTWATRRHFSAEDKITIVLGGLRGDDSIAELCRKENIAQRADIDDQSYELASERSKLSPRELAVRFTDGQRYFVSKATVYRLLNARDLPLNSSEGPDP